MVEGDGSGDKENGRRGISDGGGDSSGIKKDCRGNSRGGGGVEGVLEVVKRFRW